DDSGGNKSREVTHGNEILTQNPPSCILCVREENGNGCSQRARDAEPVCEGFSAFSPPSEDSSRELNNNNRQRECDGCGPRVREEPESRVRISWRNLSCYARSKQGRCRAPTDKRLKETQQRIVGAYGVECQKGIDKRLYPVDYLYRNGKLEARKHGPRQRRSAFAREYAV